MKGVTVGYDDLPLNFARTTKTSSVFVFKLPRWSLACIVKEAAEPAVASDSPCPVAIETVPEVRAGKTVAEKGLPCTPEDCRFKLFGSFVNIDGAS